MFMMTTAAARMTMTTTATATMMMMMISNDVMAGVSLPENPFLQTPIIPVVAASG